MKSNNPPRDLTRSTGSATTTPVTYKSSAAVYRSLAAVPSVPFEVEKQAVRAEKPFAPLVGPQSKNQGEVVWTETKHAAPALKELCPLPIPLIVANAPHTSLFLESNPVSKVVTAVHELFELQHIDVHYNESKFKWKCACYDAQVETRFVSRLYSVPDKPNFFVLDFQRRAGDPFYFQSIYNAINFKLLKSGFVVACAEKSIVEPQIRSFRPLALPDDFFPEDDCDEQKSAEDFEPLCKMCASPFIDVQREGLLVLANQLNQDENARRCLASYCEKLMEIVSLSRDTQVRRLATAAIANASVEVSCHRYIKEKNGLRILAKLVTDDNELPETRRQAAHVLKNVRDWDNETKAMIKGANIAKDLRLAELLHCFQ